MIFLVLALVIVWAIGCVFIWRWAKRVDRAERDTLVVREWEEDFE